MHTRLLTIAIILFLCHEALCEVPFFSHERLMHKNLVPRGGCDKGQSRIAYTLAQRIYGHCINMRVFVDINQKKMESQRQYFIRQYSMYFDAADADENGNMTIAEFMRFARYFYGDFLGLPFQQMNDLYNKYMLINDRNNRSVVAAGWFQLDRNFTLKHTWRLMNNDGNVFCMSGNEYMDGYCMNQLSLARLMFGVYDTNHDGLVTKSEFKNIMMSEMGDDPVLLENRWKMANANNDKVLTLPEMLAFTRMLLSVL